MRQRDSSATKNEDAGIGVAAPVLGEKTKQRLAGDLRDRVPDRNVERAHRHRVFATYWFGELVSA